MLKSTISMPIGISPASDLGKLITALNRLETPYIINQSPDVDLDDEISIGAGFYIQIAEGYPKPYCIWVRRNKKNETMLRAYASATSAAKMVFVERDRLKKIKKKNS